MITENTSKQMEKTQKTKNELTANVEIDTLPRVTQIIFEELGEDLFLEVIFSPSNFARAGDNIWGMMSDAILTQNGSVPISRENELQYQYWKDKVFQNLIAERMGLQHFFESKNYKVGARTLSEAFEGLLAAVWYKRGGISMPLPFDIASGVLDLLMESERNMKKFATDEEEIFSHAPNGRIAESEVPGTKLTRVSLVDGEIIIASVDRRGHAKAMSALAKALRTT